MAAIRPTAVRGCVFETRIVFVTVSLRGGATENNHACQTYIDSHTRDCVIKTQDRVRFLSAKRTCQRRGICTLPTRPTPRHHTHSDQAEATALATHPDQLHPQPGHGSQGMAAKAQQRCQRASQNSGFKGAECTAVWYCYFRETAPSRGLAC